MVAQSSLHRGLSAAGIPSTFHLLPASTYTQARNLLGDSCRDGLEVLRRNLASQVTPSFLTEHPVT